HADSEQDFLTGRRQSRLRSSRRTRPCRNGPIAPQFRPPTAQPPAQPQPEVRNFSGSQAQLSQAWKPPSALYDISPDGPFDKLPLIAVDLVSGFPLRHGRAKARRKAGVNALVLAAIHALPRGRKERRG